MANNTKIDKLDDSDNDINLEDPIDTTAEDNPKLSEKEKRGLLKRREIDDLLEKRRLEKELRDSLDDLNEDFDDDFDDDFDA